MSLQDEISRLISVKPDFGDPEDDGNLESSVNFLKKANYHEHDDNDDLNVGKLRKQNVHFLSDLSSRYSGKKVSRKALLNESDNDEEMVDGGDFDENQEEDESELDKEDGEQFEENDLDIDDEEDDEIDEDEEKDDEIDEDEEENSETDGKNNEIDDEANDEDNNVMKTFSNVNENNELEKGKCVNNQLLLWDFLLEMRIKFQKLISNANKLPQKSTWPKIEKNGATDFENAQKRAINELSVLFNTLIEIDNLIKSQKNIKSNESNSDEEINSDEASGIEDNDNEDDKEKDKIKENRHKKIKLFEQDNYLNKRHNEMKPIRDNIIDHWFEKTRYSTNAKLNKSSLENFEESTVKLINQILSNRDRLIKRTQLKRSVYDVIGKEIDDNLEDKTDNNYDSEIFDDDDFYHQLLRELIESKTNANINDPIAMSQKWIELQKARSKLKRKNSTSLSKERTIQFDKVHSTMINFMAPIIKDQWTDEAKDELFGSLFGKRKHVFVE